MLTHREVVGILLLVCCSSVSSSQAACRMAPIDPSVAAYFTLPEGECNIEGTTDALPICKLTCSSQHVSKTIPIKCIEKDGKYLFPWPNPIECRYYCHGPDNNNQFEHLKTLPQREADFDALNDPAVTLPALSWADSPLTQPNLSDRLKFLHGGPREVWEEQPLSGGRFINTKDKIEAAYLNAAGCPHGADQIRLISGNKFENLPTCRISCSNHRPDESISKDPWRTMIGVSDIHAPWTEIKCTYNERTRRFEYQIPVAPNCAVVACWGYDGARTKLPSGEILEWTPTTEIKNPDIIPKECQPDPSKPQQRASSTYRNAMARNFPAPVWYDVSRFKKAAGVTKRTGNLRKVLLSPWPTTQEIWSLDATIAPAPFPISDQKIDCDVLNSISELTQDGQIEFQRNPNPDPSKQPWEEGGECFPSTKAEASKPVDDNALIPGPETDRTSHETQQVGDLDKSYAVPPLPVRVSSSCGLEAIGGIFYDGSPVFGGNSQGSLQLRVGQGTQFLSSLTPADALQFMRDATSPLSLWGDAFSGGFLCSEEPSLANGMWAPGGDLGQFVLALTVWEVAQDSRPQSFVGNRSSAGLPSAFLELEDQPSSAQSFSQQDVLNALVSWLLTSRVKSFSWCVTEQMLARLCKQLSWCPRDIRSFLEPPLAIRSLLVDPEEGPRVLGGSRFVGAMLEYPDLFLVRPGLIKLCIWAVYSLFWRLDTTDHMDSRTFELARAKIRPVIMGPPRQAQAIIDVSGRACPSSFYPLISTQAASGYHAIAVHSDALEVYRLRLASFVSSQMSYTDEPPIIEIEKAIRKLGNDAWSNYVQMYSEGIPTYCVQYEPSPGTTCAFSSPFPGGHERLSSVPYVSTAFNVAQDPTTWRFTRPHDFHSVEIEEIESLVRAQNIRWSSSVVAGFGALDGRQREPVIGAPGADMGQFITVIGFFESSLGVEFTLTNVELLLVEYLKTTASPSFTMYTDVQSLGAICRLSRSCPRIPTSNDDPSKRTAQVLSQLINVDPKKVPSLLRAVSSTDMIGDRFLRMLVEGHAQTLYGGPIRGRVAEMAIQAFYGILWGQVSAKVDASTLKKVRSKLDMVVLEGDLGREVAIVTITGGPSTPSSQAPLLQPEFAGKQVVYLHSEAARQRRLQILEMLLSRYPSFTEELAVARLDLEVTAKLLLDLYFDTYNPTLPRYVLQFQ